MIFGLDFRPLKMATIGNLETSLRIYHHSLHSNPEEGWLLFWFDFIFCLISGSVKRDIAIPGERRNVLIQFILFT